MRNVVVLAMLVACGRENVDELPDHDGDGIVDIYDSCPSMYDQGAEDRDGDGVGDPCDPHLTVPGDEMVSYTFFDHEFGDWVPDTIDNWSLEGEDLTTTADADSTAARLTLDTEATSPAIELMFVIDDYGTTAIRFENQLFVTMSNSGNTVSCVLSNRADAARQLDTLGATSDLEASGLLTLPVGQLMVLRMTYDQGGTHCVANEATLTNGTNVPVGSALHSQIIVNHFKPTLRSAVVYRSP